MNTKTIEIQSSKLYKSYDNKSKVIYIENDDESYITFRILEFFGDAYDCDFNYKEKVFSHMTFLFLKDFMHESHFKKCIKLNKKEINIVKEGIKMNLE